MPTGKKIEMNKPREEKNTIEYLSNRISAEYTAKVEGGIRAYLKPKPFWLTNKMWVWLVSKFIKIEMLQPEFTIKESK